MIKLPTHDECVAAIISKNYTALHKFIYENEPGDPHGEEVFRSGLQAVIDEINESKAKHICNLWINPETRQYEVDHLDHPFEELIHAYDAPSKAWRKLTKEQRTAIIDQWHHDEGKLVDLCKDIEFKLKEINRCQG